jgi:hypothetical protein
MISFTLWLFSVEAAVKGDVTGRPGNREALNGNSRSDRRVKASPSATLSVPMLHEPDDAEGCSLARAFRYDLC